MAAGTLAFLLGVITFQQLRELPPPESAVAASFILICLAVLSYRRAAWRHWCLIGALSLLGFGWAWLRASMAFDDMLPAALEGQDLVIEGRVEGLSEIETYRTRFQFAATGARHGGVPLNAFPRRLRLDWYQKQATKIPQPGERWRFTVRLKRPHGMANPGGFDYEAWLFVRGIRATGYVREKGENRRLGLSDWEAPVDRARALLARRVQAALGDSRHTGVITALVIGEQSAIPPAQWDVFTATGTGHLVAISGSHVALVAGFIGWLVLRLWRFSPLLLRWPAPKIAALAAFMAAFGYALLAGFSVPTQRALVMVAVAAGAVLIGRPTRPWALLALALWGVILFDPLAVLSPGFWMSFGAVALIFFGLGERLMAKGIWWQWGRVQMVVAVGLLPVLALFFGNASISAPVANIVAVPWVSFLVVPLALAGALVAVAVPWLGGWLLQGAGILMAWLWPFLEFLAGAAPIAHFVSAPVWIVLAGALGTLWLLAPRGWPARWLGIVWILPLLGWQAPRPVAGEAWLTLLDVGQGLAAVVETASHTLVYDTGPGFGPDFDTGEAVVGPFLQARGSGKIDVLVISHGDNDHIGGARSLTAQWPVSQVLTGVPDKLDWTRSEPCLRGRQWQWDGVVFEILHPPATTTSNDGSCVLRVMAVGGAFLLTGDIEARAEQALLASGSDLRARVLVVPHHGSKTSSTEAFVTAVRPEIALYPVGYRNRYRLPDSNVVARYERPGTVRFSNAENGAIHVRLAPDGRLTTATWREQSRRYYHWR